MRNGTPLLFHLVVSEALSPSLKTIACFSVLNLASSCLSISFIFGYSHFIYSKSELMDAEWRHVMQHFVFIVIGRLWRILAI